VEADAGIDLDRFARDLFRHGVYVLRCGGGVLPDADRAVRELGATFGERGLLRGCCALVLEPHPPVRMPEGVHSAAFGVIARLADRGLLEELIALRAEALAGGPPGRRETLDYVVASVSRRLGVAPPTDLPPLDPQEESLVLG